MPRIYDIAKGLGIESKDVLTKAKALGIAAARVPSSDLDKATAQLLENAIKSSLAGGIDHGLLGIRVANFKAFADRQSVPLKPLTLVFGANSSGKSSVIHALLLAHEGLATGNLDVFKTRVGGDAVDLGGFRQFVHRREVNRRVEWSAELPSRNLQGQSFAVLGNAKSVTVSLVIELPLDDTGTPQPDSIPRLAAYEIEADGRTLIRLSRREEGVMQVDTLDQEAFSPLLRALLVSFSTTEAVATEDQTVINRALDELVPELRFECGALLPRNLKDSDFGTGTMHQLVALRRDNRQEQLAGSVRLFIPRAVAEVVAGVNDALAAQLNRVTYLGPLRSFPPRHLAFVEDNDRNWYAGGGYAWDAVRKNSALRASVNVWLGDAKRMQTPYRLIVERLFTGSDVKESLGRGLRASAADIVAGLIGEPKVRESDQSMLLAVRDEIQMERGDVEERLATTEAIRKNFAVTLPKLRNGIEGMTSQIQKLQMQRDIAQQDPGKHSEVQALVNQIATLQEQASEFASSTKLFAEQDQDLEKEAAAHRDKLLELDRKMAEIFSEFEANVDEERLAKRLFEAIQQRSERSPMDELSLTDCRTDTAVTHRDVGIGVSQVLPVLVHAYADQGKLIAIEQPEIHLHPALQAELGDLFIESALGDRRNTFILETHSEHLILRILRRVRETTEKRLPAGATPITPGDISVMFIEPTAKGSIIRLLPVTADGDFAAPWPGGFFAERFQDLP